MVRKTRRRTLLFQHIPVIQEYKKLKKDPDGEYSLGAQHYSVPDGALLEGEIHESPCPPLENGDEFESWKRTGDIVAAFFGHDHVNDFIIPYEGIDLVNTNSTGFYIYGAGENHGARLVTLRESDPTAYETRMLYYKDLIGTKLPFGFAGTWGTYVQSIVLLAVCALVLVLTGAVCLTVHLVKKRRRVRR